MSKIIDIAGNRYGKLTVIGFKGIINHVAIWICKCECGNITEVPSQRLREGHTKSCGNHQGEFIRKSSKYHGASRERLFSIWRHMIGRCTNKKEIGYKYYGGRGISVCTEWFKYENFKKWALKNKYKNNLTLERANVNGNYCPKNCTWITLQEQQQNKCNSIKINYQGELKTLKELSEVVGIPESTLRVRYWKGVRLPELLNHFDPRSKLIKINGQTKTVGEWAKLYNLSRSTIWTRISKGIEGEELVRKPHKGVVKCTVKNV